MTEILDVAGRLADRFAERAARHDRDNTFPHENYDDLREAGFLRLSVPEELGGLGAAQREILAVLERLAMGCGSTALAYTMHVSPLGQWASVWRRTGNPRLADLLRLAAENKLVWASVTSEMGLTNLVTDARTRADKTEGGYRVNGRKSFATNTSVATHCTITARHDDTLLICRIALDQPGVRVHDVWDTLGMRATRSNDVELDDVFVREEDVVHSLPAGHFDRRVFETVWAWAMPAFAAVYTGIAAGALEWVATRAEDDPLVRDAFGECTALLESSRALIFRHAEEVDGGRLFELGTQDGIARCVLVKYAATNNAVRVVQRLVDVAGGAAYARALPFERRWRDVQAGVVMPASNHLARQLIGASPLGQVFTP
ncbi:acyl-CoA dehydrogenase [Lentzea tibetensis]|uniref:Acyl-CoA dehydrogenase n=1 Tax=Lentzea tibetensis TaxID=2591470 RepID=A0A563EIJ5_9PSEU|nr:acyl-CoA dehydrogenase family protein [Lentzea tibetensis]TWP46436.1 acyl-CoA dehydrogenase [Lentzea tibetensis]